MTDPRALVAAVHHRVKVAWASYAEAIRACDPEAGYGLRLDVDRILEAAAADPDGFVLDTKRPSPGQQQKPKVPTPADIWRERARQVGGGR
jgi:hypothetical protein